MRTFHYTVVVCFLLSSCRLAGGVEAIEKSPVSGRCERVALQLSWRHKFQFAGYYMAKEKGFYRDAGFDVELREWRGGISSVRSVVLGRADFGISQGSLRTPRASITPSTPVSRNMRSASAGVKTSPFPMIGICAISFTRAIVVQSA